MNRIILKKAFAGFAIFVTMFTCQVHAQEAKLFISYLFMDYTIGEKRRDVILFPEDQMEVFYMGNELNYIKSAPLVMGNITVDATIYNRGNFNNIELVLYKYKGQRKLNFLDCIGCDGNNMYRHYFGMCLQLQEKTEKRSFFSIDGNVEDLTDDGIVKFKVSGVVSLPNINRYKFPANNLSKMNLPKYFPSVPFYTFRVDQLFLGKIHYTILVDGDYPPDVINASLSLVRGEETQVLLNEKPDEKFLSKKDQEIKQAFTEAGFNIAGARREKIGNAYLLTIKYVNKDLNGAVYVCTDSKKYIIVLKQNI